MGATPDRLLGPLFVATAVAAAALYFGAWMAPIRASPLGALPSAVWLHAHVACYLAGNLLLLVAAPCACWHVAGRVRARWPWLEASVAAVALFWAFGAAAGFAFAPEVWGANPGFDDLKLLLATVNAAIACGVALPLALYVRFGASGFASRLALAIVLVVMLVLAAALLIWPAATLHPPAALVPGG